MTDSDEEPVNGENKPARTPWWRHPVVAVVALLMVTTAVSAPLVFQRVNRHHQMSIYDEASYYDYLYKVHSKGHYIIGEGEKLAPEPTRELACRGIRNAYPRNHRVCHRTKPAKPTLYDTADIDPPTYTVLTDLGARVFLRLGVTHNLLVAGRLANVFWAGLTLTLMMLFCRRLGAGWWSAVPVAGIAFMIPLNLQQWTYLTPHSMEMAVSIAVVWTAVNWMERGGHWWALFLAGLVPPWIKATDVLGVGIAIVALLAAIVLSSLPWRRMLVGAGLLTAGCAVGTVSWLLIRKHYALVTQHAPSRYDAGRFRLTYLTQAFGDFLRPTMTGPLYGFGVVITVLMFGAASWALFSQVDGTGLRAVIRPLGLSALVGGAFGAWLFVGSNYILLGHYIGLPIRYGLGVTPIALALLAVCYRSRAARVVLFTIAVLLLTIALSPKTWYGSYVPLQ